MIIVLPPHQICEVHLEGTHDAISVHHIPKEPGTAEERDMVKVKEFVTNHHNGLGRTIFNAPLNSKKLPLNDPQPHEALNHFDMIELIAKFGLQIEWVKTNETEYKEVCIHSLVFGGHKFCAQIEEQTDQGREQALFNAFSQLVKASERRVNPRGPMLDEEHVTNMRNMIENDPYKDKERFEEG